MLKQLLNRLKHKLTPTTKPFKQYLSDNCIIDHNWSKWNQSEENRSTIYPQTNKEFKYKRSVQIRRCINCNKIQKEYI